MLLLVFLKKKNIFKLFLSYGFAVKVSIIFKVSGKLIWCTHEWCKLLWNILEKIEEKKTKTTKLNIENNNNRILININDKNIKNRITITWIQRKRLHKNKRLKTQAWNKYN